MSKFGGFRYSEVLQLGGSTVHIKTIHTIEELPGSLALKSTICLASDANESDIV